FAAGARPHEAAVLVLQAHGDAARRGRAPAEAAVLTLRKGGTTMCLTCRCMQAHLEMGEKNIRIEDVMAAADENGRSLAATLDIVNRTIELDKAEHAEEYAEDR